jgi:hypothetical protein
MEEADALRDLLFYYIRRSYDDTDGCRSLAEHGIYLDGEKAHYAAHQIAESYGRCGGDCSKISFADTRRDCERGSKKYAKIKDDEAKAAIKAATGKSPEQVEQEQAVSCDSKKARGLIANMDQRAFRDQGLRFIQKYRDTCGKRMTPEFKESLANDEALLHFHGDDDAACTRALSELTAAVSDSTAYNRTLCGGPCTLDAGKCASALDARKKALAGRALRTKRREVTESFCWVCPPGKPCKAQPKGERRLANSGRAVSWDLKSARYVGGGDVDKPYKLLWAGDLNGDGIGDLINVRRDKTHLYDYLYGREAWDGDTKDYVIPFKIFEVELGCGRNNQFRNIWTEETARAPYAPEVGTGEPGDSLEDFDLRIEKRPNTDIPFACIYNSAPTCTPKPCQDPPLKCLDLSEWEKAGGAAKQ